MGYSKKIKRELRKLVPGIYEREHEIYLNKLFEYFQDWKSGKICAGELSDRIHNYYKGPSREMYSYYNNLDPDIIVIHAIKKGLISKSEILQEVLEAINYNERGSIFQ